MKIFILWSVVCFIFLLAFASAEDDQATDDQAPVEDAAEQAPTDDVDPAADQTTEDNEVLNDPAAADQDIPAELFKAHQKTEWTHFRGRSPYPPIHQGGRPTPQHPGPFKALRVLKDHKKADGNYPKHTRIPAAKNFRCDKVHQAGFYADEEFGCQVFRRCDLNGGLTSYLCPVQTVFNQITLVCDWYYNVRCSRSSDFYDYSNSRLYHVDWPLLGGGERGYGHDNGYGHHDHGYGEEHHDHHEHHDNGYGHHDNGYGHEEHHEHHENGYEQEEDHEEHVENHHAHGDGGRDGHEQDVRK